METLLAVPKVAAIITRNHRGPRLYFSKCRRHPVETKGMEPAVKQAGRFVILNMMQFTKPSIVNDVVTP